MEVHDKRRQKGDRHRTERQEAVALAPPGAPPAYRADPEAQRRGLGHVAAVVGVEAQLAVEAWGAGRESQRVRHRQGLGKMERRVPGCSYDAEAAITAAPNPHPCPARPHPTSSKGAQAMLAVPARARPIRHVSPDEQRQRVVRAAGHGRRLQASTQTRKTQSAMVVACVRAPGQRRALPHPAARRTPAHLRGRSALAVDKVQEGQRALALPAAASTAAAVSGQSASGRRVAAAHPCPGPDRRRWRARVRPLTHLRLALRPRARGTPLRRALARRSTVPDRRKNEHVVSSMPSCELEQRFRMFSRSCGRAGPWAKGGGGTRSAHV